MPVVKDKKPRVTFSPVAIEQPLNEHQRRFCELFASDREFFGNGLQSYMEAYGIAPSKWKSAASSASRLLKNDKILAYINRIMEEAYLNDTFVDKQLGFLITQQADFKSKLGGIKEYNKLKKRVDSMGGEFPAPQLHLHLHKERKVVKIVSEAEDKLRKELGDKITTLSKKESAQSIQKADGEGKDTGKKSDTAPAEKG